MFKKFIALLAAIPAIVGVIVVMASTPAPNYSNTFDGAPSNPVPYTSSTFLDGWDVQVHDRDAARHPGTTTSTVAMHGSDCSAPPASHLTSGSFGDAVFQCANHIMTSINSDDTGYAVIYLTPPEMVDISTEGVVSFDVSTNITSNRDWLDLTISPFLDAQALPLLSDLSQGVDLQEPNRNSVVIATDNGETRPNLKVVTNGNSVSYGSPGISSWDSTLNTEIVSGTNQAATRQPFRLTLSRTHVKFERLASATGNAITYVDTDIPQLAWSQGVVQIGHHSYTPSKACDYDGSCGPNTWHWDNIAISPAIPFSIQKATTNFTTGGTVNFPSAPANAYLRFGAIGKVKVNGVSVATETTGNAGHMGSYLVPIAQGSTSATISMGTDDWYQGPFIAEGLAIWSLSQSINTPTSVATTVTSTIVIPTSTPTAVSTTVVPTSTPTVTPTRTPSPIPTVTVRPKPWYCAWFPWIRACR